MEQEEHQETDNPAEDHGGLWKRKKIANNNIKEARGLGHGRGGLGPARYVKRADTKAQRWVDTDMADRDRSDRAPKTKKSACAGLAAQDDRMLSKYLAVL
jgi:hypothetical protein